MRKLPQLIIGLLSFLNPFREGFSRKTPVARIVPSGLSGRQKTSVDWSQHGTRLKKLWKGRNTGTTTSKLLNELRGER